MLRSRVLLCLLALVLAVPAAAFAQGAGDEQYADPVPDTPAQNGGGGGGGGGGTGGGGGLTDEPPGGGTGGGGGGSTEPGAGGGTTDPGAGGGAGSTGESGSGEGAAARDSALPNTGSDPRILAYIAIVFLMVGIGLRLRTIDPDHF